MNTQIFYDLGLASKRIVKTSEFIFNYSILCKSGVGYYDKRYSVYIDCDSQYYPSYYRENKFMWDRIKTKYFEFEGLGVVGDTNEDNGVNIGYKLKLKFYKLEDSNGNFIEGFKGDEKIIFFSEFATPPEFIKNIISKHSLQDYVVNDDRTRITQGQLFSLTTESFVNKVEVVNKPFKECGDFMYKQIISPNILELNRLKEFNIGFHVNLLSLHKK